MPADWRRRRLGEVLRLEYGKSLPEKARRSGHVAVVGSAGVVGEHTDALLRGPGVVVGRKGSIGTVTWIEQEFFPIDTTYYVEPVDGQADLRWVFQMLSREDLSRLNRATGVPGLNRDDVYALVRPVPPLEEQRAIAAVLDAVDDTIESTEAVIAATEELRRSLLEELLTRGVPGWHSEWKQVAGLGTVPACWDVTTLGEVGKWMSGGTPSKQREDYWNGSIPWISAKDMKVREIWDATDHITEDAAQQGSRIIGPGSILVVVRGMILAHSFPIAITRADCAFNQDLRALVCRDGVVPEFVVAAMESRRRRLLDLPTTSTHGTKRIITEELQSVQIPLPPTAEQEHIARAVDALDTTTVEEGSTVAQLRQSKAALADALLTGDLRVPLRSMK